MQPRIDLNADLGESFGAWRLGDDATLLEVVTSANVACGFHAGDWATMARTVDLALARGVAVGAHPGLPDLQGFGRREMAVSPREAHDLVLYQMGALEAFLRTRGSRLNHVKPHGALYNMAARDGELAAAIAEAVRDFDSDLVLVGLSGSELVRAGAACGLKVASEAFADRAYEADGSLTPRAWTGSVLDGEEDVVSRAVRMVRLGKVRARTGEEVGLRVDTLCLHGDGPHAVSFARELRAALAVENVTVEPVLRREFNAGVN
jgi:5-oxoprolinase (ATP-hydrolysing) subunit A